MRTKGSKNKKTQQRIEEYLKKQKRDNKATNP